MGVTEQVQEVVREEVRREGLVRLVAVERPQQHLKEVRAGLMLAEVG